MAFVTLIFLLALLGAWVWLNRGTVGRVFGIQTSPCDWSRIESRDSDGQAAWFCPSCRMEAYTDDGKPPLYCGLDRQTR